MRAASHIDFRTAVKMSQQASACSGFPVLTPLPTYTGQIVDECYSYSGSPGRNLVGFSAATDPTGLSMSGRLTPQTPESLVYHEPLAVGDLSDQWAQSQPWIDDSLMSVGLSLDSDMAAPVPVELWSRPEHSNTAPITQMSWNQASVSVSPQLMSDEVVPNAGAVPSLSISECSVDDFNNSGTFHEDWALCQPTTTQLGMAGIVTSVPFMHDLRSMSSAAPVWEDVFMPGHPPY
jgi:hypothetical protein